MFNFIVCHFAALVSAQNYNNRLTFSGTIKTQSGDSVYQRHISQNYVANETIVQANCTANRFVGFGQITYSLLSGENFVINHTTGAVSLRVDGITLCEGSSCLLTANIQCELRQNRFSSYTAVATLELRVSILDEFTPVFQHNSTFLRLSFQENVSRGDTIADLNATDMDRGACGEIVYTITSLAGSDTFALNSSTGLLTFTQSLDYEATSTYTLVISAGPSNTRQCNLSAIFTLYIDVVDVNDVSPQFQQPVYNVDLEENNQQRNFRQVQCNDPDTTSSISYNFATESHEPFKINPRNGRLSLSAPLDYEQETSYLLNVVCTDGRAELHSPQRDYAIVNVTVLPVNEYRPVISDSGELTLTMYNNLPPGTLLLSPHADRNALQSFTVTDRDEGPTDAILHYELTMLNETFYSHFHLNQNTGDLSLARQFNNTQCQREAGTANFLRIQVTITVCDIVATEKCPTLTVSVFVLPSDCLPLFPRMETVLVNETAPVGTELAHISCTDDGVYDQNMTVAISSEDAEVASTFALSSSGVLVLRRPLDYETRESYTIALTCTNAYGNEAETEVDVSVLPQNDRQPFFDKTVFLINLTLSDLTTIPHLIWQLEATDLDRDVGNSLTFSSSGPHRYISVESNGAVWILDIPLPGDLLVVGVSVSDGDFSSEATLVVHSEFSSPVQAASQVDSGSRNMAVVLIIVVVVLAFLLVFSWIMTCLLYVRGKQRLMQAMESHMTSKSKSVVNCQCRSVHVPYRHILIVSILLSNLSEKHQLIQGSYYYL